MWLFIGIRTSASDSCTDIYRAVDICGFLQGLFDIFLPPPARPNPSPLLFFMSRLHYMFVRECV